MKARVFWLPTELGGRQKPVWRQYAATAKFVGHESTNHWSVCLRCDSDPELGKTYDAAAELLCPDAPKDLLVSGRQFTVHEGSRIVGVGRVL